MSGLSMTWTLISVLPRLILENPIEPGVGQSTLIPANVGGVIPHGCLISFRDLLLSNRPVISAIKLIVIAIEYR